MIPIGAAIAGASALSQGIAGLFQRAKARKLERQLVRPTMKVQNEFISNAAKADNMAKVGMNQQQYNNSVNNIQRNTNSALRQFGRLGSPAGLASIVRAQNDATMGLDAQDAQMRNQNERMAIQQNAILGSQKQNAWDFNFKDKYFQDLSKVEAMRGAGTQNLGGAFNTAANLGIMSTQGQEMGDLFGSKKTTFAAPKFLLPVSKSMGIKTPKMLAPKSFIK